MQDKIIDEINKLLKEKKRNRKQIYENLLAKGVVKPNSEKLIYEIIEYSLDNGLISKSKIITYRKKKGKLSEVFTTEQLIKVFDEVERPKLAVTLWLGFFCGLRIREVCNLRTDDLNLNDKLLFVRNSKNTNRSIEGYGKDRIVSIPEIAISPLKKWLNIIGDSSKYVIPSMQDPNKPIRTKTIHEQYRYLLKRCGLNQEEYSVNYRQKNYGKRKDMKKNIYKYRFHTLRGTYATYLLEKGVPLENIQRSLGHNQIETTLVYAKIRDNRTKQLINNAFNTPLRLVNNESILNNPNKQESKPEQANIEPETILKQRLARGEIDLITYKRLLTELDPENTVNVIVQNTNS